MAERMPGIECRAGGIRERDVDRERGRRRRCHGARRRRDQCGADPDPALRRTRVRPVLAHDQRVLARTSRVAHASRLHRDGRQPRRHLRRAVAVRRRVDDRARDRGGGRARRRVRRCRSDHDSACAGDPRSAGRTPCWAACCSSGSPSQRSWRESGRRASSAGRWRSPPSLRGPAWCGSSSSRRRRAESRLASGTRRMAGQSLPRVYLAWVALAAAMVLSRS